MNDWKKINEAFSVAVELGATEQADFLRKIDDENLRRKVQAILDASERAAEKDFLGMDAFADGARVLNENDKSLSVKKIGNYKILKEIGRGGMGAIYLAEREDFHHRVALKLIKRGMDTDEIIRRFEREREVLGALNHPNITKLLDGGTTDDGLPFLVMEFVEGVPVTDFCGQNSLSIEQRLELFRKVCSAVAFAHQNLIVHRDLKPSNILITSEGEPKLLDFGIAKLLAPEYSGQTTETAFRLLTPEYASPEQIRGERVTTASDVYSLGVLLYELLTGQRPFEIASRNMAEIIRAVCETEPTKPSDAVTLDRNAEDKETKDQKQKTKNNKIKTQQLRGDLDNIILKAIRKENAQRYSSVEQFAEDIARYLNGLPIIARPATFGYKAAKFIERNRTTVAFASLALLALLTGLSIAVWQAYVAKQERARAERRFEEVRKLANQLVSDWDKDIPESLVSNEVRGRIADISTEYLDALSRETDDPALLKELAKAYTIVGHEYSWQFVHGEKARTSLRKAEAILRRLLTDAPDDIETKRLLRESLGKYDEFFGERDRAESVKTRLEIVRLSEEILAVEPDDPKEIYNLAVSYAINGLVLRFVGRNDESAEYFRRAVETHKRRVEILERTAVMLDDQVRIINAYAILAGDQTSVPEESESAVKNNKKSVEIAERLFAENPKNGRIIFEAVGAYFQFGLILKKTGDINRSLESFRKSLEYTRLHKNLFATDNGYFHAKEQESLREIAEALNESGDKQGALASLKESIELRRKQTERNKAALNTYLGHGFRFVSAGKLLTRMKQFDEARAVYKEAEESLQKVLKDEPKKILTHRALAELYLLSGDLNAGFGVCDFQRSKDYFNVSVVNYCPPETNNITADQVKLREARTYYQKAVDIYKDFETRSIAQFDDENNLVSGTEKLEICTRKLNGER